MANGLYEVVTKKLITSSYKQPLRLQPEWFANKKEAILTLFHNFGIAQISYIRVGTEFYF